MTITARFPSTCSACHQPIALGAKIEWTKGSPARHTTCSAASSATKTRRPSSAAYGSYRTIGARMNARMQSTGWTGCSCGSIEDQPRASDCATCQFDTFD